MQESETVVDEIINDVMSVLEENMLKYELEPTVFFSDNGEEIVPHALSIRVELLVEGAIPGGKFIATIMKLRDMGFFVEKVWTKKNKIVFTIEKPL